MVLEAVGWDATLGAHFLRGAGPPFVNAVNVVIVYNNVVIGF